MTDAELHAAARQRHDIRVLHEWPRLPTIESSAFNAFNQPGKIKDARGNYTILKYDGRGNLLETIRLRSGVGPGIDPATYVPAAGDVVAWTINTYDPFGNLLSTRRVRDAATQAGLLLTGFTLGPRAFSSTTELGKTVLHELHQSGDKPVCWRCLSGAGRQGSRRSGRVRGASVPTPSK